MKILSTFLLLHSHLTSSVKLLRRELTGYPLAKCNDGSIATYYHDQDVRRAGERLMIYLADSGHGPCSTADDCKKRCAPGSPDKQSCSASKDTVLELRDGIWSSNSDDNPFADYFKVYIHSCTNDDFSGTREASRLTGNLYFHGKHIVTSMLQDLVSTFGVNKASSVVLVGSGSGARGVGYNCDYVSDAIKTVNNRADVRCILDGPDFTPWWVKTDVASCKGKDINRLEQEHFLWGKVADQSCVKASAGNTSEIFHQCGVFSRYWKHVTTPYFLISSQYDPTYFDTNPCGPGDSDPQYAAYQLSWRRGTIALTQVMQDTRKDVGIFSANCDSHTLLSGVLASQYWSQLSVPLFEIEEGESSLNSALFQWLSSDSVQAVDSLMRNNTKCVSAAPHRVQFGSCTGRLITCNSQATLLPSVARSGGYGWRRGLIRRLSPPSWIWPSSYDQHRRCGLDHFYSGCGSSVHGVSHVPRIASSGCSTCRTSCVGGCSHGTGGTFLSGSGDRVVPESAIPAAGRSGRLWRRFYYLQYLKLLYNKLKAEYAREYHLTAGHGSHGSGHNIGKVFSSIKSSADYVDFYDDYYDDYDYHGDDIFARIVKAVKKNKAEKRKNGVIDPSKVLIDSVQEDFVFPQELLDSLPDIDDVDYEDFETLNEQVESFNNIRKKKNF